LADLVNARVHHQSSKNLKANFTADLKAIKFGFVVYIRVSHTLQNLKDEFEELGAVDVTFKGKLHVVLSHVLVDIVGHLSVCGLPILAHLEVFLLLLIVLHIFTLGLLLFDLVGQHNDLEILLDTALIEKHVA